MEIPILKQGNVLIATLQAAVPDVDLLSLRIALVREVVRSRSRGVIVDVTPADSIVAADRKAARLEVRKNRVAV